MSTTSSGYSRRGVSSLLAPPAPPSSTQPISQPVKFTASPDTVVKPSPFLADFVDCIENLPNRLQLLLSELRNIDLLIKTRHRGIQLVKEEITRRASSDEHPVTDSNQLLKQLHQLLIECQQLADQKIKLTTQIIETISHKARQLGFDHKSNEVKQIPKELNEENILADFRLAIKKTRSVPHLHHHYSGSSSSNLNNINNRTSSRNINNHNNIGAGGSNNSQQLINSASKSKLAYDINNNNKSGLKSSLNVNGNVGKGQANCRTSNNGNDTSINSMNKSLRNMITSGSGNKKKNHSPVELNKRSIKKMKLDNSSTTTSSGVDSAQTRSKRQLNYTSSSVKSNQPAHQSKSIHVIGSTLAKKRRLNSLSTGGVKSPSSTLSSSSTMSSSFRIKQQQLKRSLNNVNMPVIKAKRQSKNSRKRANEETATSDDDGNHNDDGENPADDYEIGNTSDENIKMNPNRNYDDEDAIQNISDADDDELFKSTAAGSTSRRSTRNRATASVDQRRKHNQRNRRSDDSDTDREENPNDELNSNETESINNIDEDNENQNNDEDENNAEDSKQQQSEIKSSTRSGRKETNAKTGGRGKGGATTTATAQTDTVSHSTSRISNNNSDEPVYCSCREISYGQMICCDNDGCSIEWFHFQCVKLTVKPKGKWYCPDCRGETHRVMKKPHLLNNNNNNTNLAINPQSSSSAAVPTTSSSPSTSSYYSKQK